MPGSILVSSSPTDGAAVKSYVCPRCFKRIFDSDAAGGRIKMVCPNRECPSRKQKRNSPPVPVTVPLGDRK